MLQTDAPIDASAVFASLREGTPSERRKVAALLAEHTRTVHYAAGATIVRAGSVPEQAFLLLEGTVRSFYIRSDGRFFNKAFALDGQFFGSLESALTRQPCRYEIEALQPSHVMAMDIAIALRLAREHPEMARIQRLEVRQAFLRSEEREGVLLTLNAEDRYRWLKRRHPELLERVPHYHLAAYLGLTPVSLSQARRAVEKSHGQI